MVRFHAAVMTHDVVGYDEVIVGEDQKVHIEYARRLLKKYNREFGTNIPLPVAKIVVGRVKDLKRTDQKMSKSSPEGCLFLDDSPDQIRDKLKAAKADPNGRENLEFLYRSFVDEKVPEMNSKLKSHLTEAMIAKFS